MKSAQYLLTELLFVAIVVSGPAVSAQSRRSHADTPDAGAPMTVEGLVRDLACPMQNHKSTATNFNLACALACAKVGSPLIILTKTDAIYFPISDRMPDTDQREKLLPYVGKYVRVSGTVFRRNGTRAIMIRSINEMKNVKLRTDLGDD